MLEIWIYFRMMMVLLMLFILQMEILILILPNLTTNIQDLVNLEANQLKELITLLHLSEIQEKPQLCLKLMGDIIWLLLVVLDGVLILLHMLLQIKFLENGKLLEIHVLMKVQEQLMTHKVHVFINVGKGHIYIWEIDGFQII